MTFRQKLQEAARKDPEFARAVRFNRLAVGILGFAVFAAIVVGALNYLALEKVSACEENPSGDRCQEVRRKAEGAESIRDKCRSFWKVGYPCPKPGTRADRSFAQQPGSSAAPSTERPQSATAEGGEAQKPPQMGSQQPGPRGGGGGPATGQAPGSPPASATVNVEPPDPPAGEQDSPVRDTVDSVAGAAQEVVEQVPPTSCKVLGEC